MRIETLTHHLTDQYETFLLAQPESLLYQSSRYQNLLIDLLGCRQESILALDETGNIQAALPLMAKDGFLGTVVNSLPYFGSNGGLIGNNSTARCALITAYNKIIETPSMAASTLIENPLAPGSLDGIVCDLIDERIGQLTPLPTSNNKESVLMHSFHYKTRNMIRKAEKLGVKVAVDNDAMPFLMAVHEENMREIGGTAKSQLFFYALPKYFRPGKDYRLYVAQLDGNLIAAVLVFYYNQTAEYYTPVVRKEYRGSQALSVTIFHAMCDAADLGYAWWNWGGTWLAQEGVYRFKSRWGTQVRPYRYSTRVLNPDILKANKMQLLAAYPSFFTVPFSALRA